MDFLQLAGRSILIMGVANRKSVAWHVAQILKEAGADVLYAVRSTARQDSIRKLVGDAPIYICDVEKQDQIDRLREEVGRDRKQLAGLVHSIAFADYSAGWQPFHATPRGAFLQAVRHLLLLADGAVECLSRPARQGSRQRRDDLNLDDANGG
jgi:enoyl-[acyl-carrier protein] reductase I